MFSTRFLVYLGIIFIGLLIGIIRWKRSGTPFRLLTGFLFLTLISEITSRVLAYTIRNSSPVYHFYVLLSCSLLAAMYFIQLKDYRKLVFGIYFCFLVFSVTNSLLFQSIMTFPTNAIIASDVVYIAFALLYYKHALEQKLLTGKNFLRLNHLVLIYFALQLFNWGFYNYLLNNKLNTRLVSDMGYWMNIIFYSSIVAIFIKMEPEPILLIESI